MRWLWLVCLLPASVVHADQPDCTGFGGMIHGSSKCVAYDVRAKRVVPSKQRVMPGDHTASGECDNELSFGSAKLQLGSAVARVVCDPVPPNDVRTVSIRFGSDKPIVLDRTQGFADFVNVWAKQDGALIRFTIDYGILE
jgi:hypothetical protein